MTNPTPEQIAGLIEKLTVPYASPLCKEAAQALTAQASEIERLRSGIEAIAKSDAGYHDTGWGTPSDSYAAGRIDVAQGAREFLAALASDPQED